VIAFGVWLRGQSGIRRWPDRLGDDEKNHFAQLRDAPKQHNYSLHFGKTFRTFNVLVRRLMRGGYAACLGP